ncbi:hypothetical protein [Vibrio diabolicus]|uniref:hypothetical protein n=1 Tax=Vibrio diabolicus TaxID=50719 RepID=UPI00215FE075|nr:hypothetical protein [Vibrio diabolicus]MCS0444598.1 hypothetical protein [Vibrio diabolicus]
MRLPEITGQRLRLALMYLADYCAAVQAERGTVDISAEVSYVNSYYELVPKDQLQALIGDVQRYYTATSEQEITGIDRANYWKFKAKPVSDAARELFGKLQELGFHPTRS